MLPVMAVPAYAANHTSVPFEYGSVVIQFIDDFNNQNILSPTILHYEDLANGEYEITLPTINGYSGPTTILGYSTIDPGNGENHERVSTIKYNGIDCSGMNEVIHGMLTSTSGHTYIVSYHNNKMDNGYVRIRYRGTHFDSAFYYYDDMTNGEYAIDLNKAGYQIVSIVNSSSPKEYVDAPNGILTGTMAQGEEIYYNVTYEEDHSAASFNAVLLLDENASVPDATISYNIAPGTGIAAVPGTSMAVLAPSAGTGVTGTPTISNAVFAPGDATVTSVDGVTIDAGEKAIVKPISVDFSGVSFAQPGIFRYVISEPSSGNNMTYDTQLNDTANGTRYQRVLDVYVVRNAEDEYEIGGFVLHEVAGAVNEGETTAADKSSGFVNEYNTTSLTLECQVEGNQSSIDKYFAYTITMQNPGNSSFNVSADWSNASGAQNPVANPATSYTNEVITAANTNEWTSNADGSMSKTIYLKDGQKVTLDGIPVGTAYSITVAEEDYGPSWVVGSDNGSNDATGNRTLNAVEDVVFTLTRDGVVPTGVALSILPGVILMGAAATFLFVMKNRKKEEASEA